jgi:hypothetical protein
LVLLSSPTIDGVHALAGKRVATTAGTGLQDVLARAHAIVAGDAFRVALEDQVAFFRQAGRMESAPDLHTPIVPELLAH